MIATSMRRFARLLSVVVVSCWTAGVSFGLVPRANAQEIDKALEERMEKEKVERRGCKIAICETARNRKADGGDISCSAVKTWPASQLKDGILKGKIDWPWGNAQCKVDIHIERKILAEAFAGGPVEMKLAKQNVNCTLDQKDGTDKYVISFALTPTVAFASGKATKATLNWSDIQGSALAKSAVWSAATLDNNIGLFQGTIVEQINAFFGESCDEVKDLIGK